MSEPIWPSIATGHNYIASLESWIHDLEEQVRILNADQSVKAATIITLTAELNTLKGQ
jgi:hypothetical protein